ncbi:MAG: dockerin type I repeat-containing protein [Candidatus Zixiibacteriota bacterium]|nr:MAG: dockerin type I repeat-containing protein [candidate division Zixibacteria bacterium]
MKPKAILFLVVFCLALGFLAMDGLCTTAKKVSADGKEIRSISEDYLPPETMQAATSPGKYSTVGFKGPADCFNLIPDPEVPAATEHDNIGTTWYDFQKNGSMGRMISATLTGLGGYRHISWMWTAAVYPGTQRRVYARSKPAAGTWSTLQEVGLGTVNSGYCNQTHLNDGNPVVLFHRTGIGGNYSYMAIADGPAANPLYTRKWDLPDDLPEGSGEPGAWPKGDILYVEDTIQPGGPLNYLHIIETEAALAAGAEQPIGYLRCYVDPGDINNLKCQTPTTGGEVYNITANTAFTDEVYTLGISCDVSGVVATNRYGGHTGARVTIAYLPQTVAGDCDQQYDAGYIECMDNGDGWLDGTDWPPTTHVVGDYAGALERAFHDISAAYDYDDSLHLVWTTTGYDPANPGTYQPGVARIYHWSKEFGVSIVASKIQEGANPAAHCLNASKVSVSPKPPGFHGDSTYLFCIWAQVDSSDQNAAGDLGNADIFGTGSFDGGNTWGKVLNLTGTKTPGCAAGDCISDHNPSLALNMEAGDLHIEYICDQDAGFGIYDEGVWTENPVMYMRVPEWPVEAGPRGDFRIEDPAHWWHPPIKVLPNQTRTIRFKLFSIGNEALTYNVTSDHPCIQVSVPPSQLAPKDSIEIPVLVDGTGACDGTFIAGNVILNYDEAGGTVKNLRVHAVVSDDYYECPRDPETFDTLENDHLRMYVNANCMQWIQDIGYAADTAHEVFFQGGNIVATTDAGDTLVGRFMGDNDMRAGAQDKLYLEQCEPDWEPHFWILFTKEIYIEASHLNPPSHMKWFWWEVAKQVKFFKSTAPEEYQRLVIKYVKVKRQDPPNWWPDLTPFTDYEDSYIGFAMDIDAPWDSADTDPPTPFVGDESATNLGAYDATNEIAYLTGFGNHEHPGYSNYHGGIALAEGGTGSPTTPFATAIIKNNHYLYPTSPWGWIDGELYRLAKGVEGASPYIEDPDSLVDRSIVMTASEIPAGTDPGTKAEFTIIEALAPTGLAQLQALVDTGRAIVARERSLGGLPAACGDVQGDFVVNVGDVVYLVTYLYKGGPAPYCPTARGDVNDDGVINVGDVVYLVTYLYKGGDLPNCPGIWAW